MDEFFSIELPRGAYTVAVVRDVLGAVLDVIGVDTESRDDVLTATSEACSNAIEHGAAGEGYIVRTRIQEEFCDVEISNPGPTFRNDHPIPPPAESESGRGILLMHGLVDRVGYLPTSNGGTRVHLHKRFGARAGVMTHTSSRSRVPPPSNATTNADTRPTCPLGSG